MGSSINWPDAIDYFNQLAKDTGGPMADSEMRGEHGRELIDLPAGNVVSVVAVHPDDVIVVISRTPTPLTQQVAEHIRNQIKLGWPDNRVLVLDNLDLALLRRAENEAGHGDS